jgi:hypothetical protein
MSHIIQKVMPPINECENACDLSVICHSFYDPFNLLWSNPFPTTPANINRSVSSFDLGLSMLNKTYNGFSHHTLLNSVWDQSNLKLIPFNVHLIKNMAWFTINVEYVHEGARCRLRALCLGVFFPRVASTIRLKEWTYLWNDVISIGRSNLSTVQTTVWVRIRLVKPVWVRLSKMGRYRCFAFSIGLQLNDPDVC